MTAPLAIQNQRILSENVDRSRDDKKLRGPEQGNRSPVMRIIVIMFLISIVASLGSALVFLFRDREGGTRTVKALALRVGLSLTLFLMLMGGFASGLLTTRL